ncbi:GyrI-like domain-containing protein [Capnocytophaga sp. ARDL2]|uniref:AraC family transcriptional regulator n=1 Tax=Capnocytophaga sp. ARDL2 TaxID=3238809 RepID=UPI0035571E28
MNTKSTQADYHERINKVLEYIGNHLDEKIELKTLAEIANFSEFHFHRIFKAFVNESVGAYITRLRVEASAILLRYSNLSVEQISERVGYEMVSSLSKSFKKFYDVSPTEYRNNKTLYIMRKEEFITEIKLKAPKIIDLEPKKVIYIALTGTYGTLNYGDTYVKLWAFVKENKLFTAGIEHICISHDDPKITEGDKQRSDICLAIHKPAKPQGEVGVKEIEGGKYAVFHYQGAYDNLGKVYDTIFGKWLPESGYELRSIVPFEKYLNDARKTPPEKLKTEIYLPIK